MESSATEQCSNETETCLKEVGGVPIKSWHSASCHCGRVELKLHLPDGVCKPRRCKCSICRRKGAVVASVLLKDLKIVRGAEHLRCYQFNTHAAEHYFCSHCGIYTHHKRRSNPDEYGYNVGCLEGVDPFDITQVPVADGVSHPADRLKSAEST